MTLRIGNATVSFVAYLRQFVWPAGLACFYPHPGDSLPAWKVAGALAVLLAITSAVILRWEKRRYLMVGWFWYTGMLVPVIGVAQVGGQSMADRYTYLPEIGLCAAIVWAAASVADAQTEHAADVQHCSGYCPWGVRRGDVDPGGILAQQRDPLETYHRLHDAELRSTL